jgi:hypothetical protein
VGATVVHGGRGGGTSRGELSYKSALRVLVEVLSECVQTACQLLAPEVLFHSTSVTWFSGTHRYLLASLSTLG